jgi:hypothetical protein
VPSEAQFTASESTRSSGDGPDPAGRTDMMGGFNFDGMFLRMMSTLGELALVLVATCFGIGSLIRRARRADDSRRGRRSALIALGIGLAVEGWTIAILPPWQNPSIAPMHWLPLPAFLLGGCALTLWMTACSRVWSKTGRLMIVIAAAALVVGWVEEVRRWDRRREMLHHARSEEEQGRRFFESYNDQRRCLEQKRRGEPCGHETGPYSRCRTLTESSLDYYATDALKASRLAEARASAYRRAAATGEDPMLVYSVD